MRYLRMPLIAVCLCWISAATPLHAQDLATPESAVRSFLAGFCGGDLDKCVACIENAKYNSAFDAFGKDLKKHPLSYTVGDVQTQLDADKATVRMTGTVSDPTGTLQKFSSVVKLHKGDGGWHIIPDKEAAAQRNPEDPVNAIACSLIEPHTLTRANDMARMASCLSNLKQIALGVLMLVQDSDEKYAVKADSYKRTIMPYIKNDKVFHCPSDDGDIVSYSFNPHIAGVSLAKINLPASTVMVYEGKAGKLNFKHAGKAGVAFADGHVRMISETDAKSLRWMP